MGPGPDWGGGARVGRSTSEWRPGPAYRKGRGRRFRRTNGCLRQSRRRCEVPYHHECRRRVHVVRAAERGDRRQRPSHRVPADEVPRGAGRRHDHKRHHPAARGPPDHAGRTRPAAGPYARASWFLRTNAGTSAWGAGGGVHTPRGDRNAESAARQPAARGAAGRAGAAIRLLQHHRHVLSRDGVGRMPGNGVSRWPATELPCLRLGQCQRRPAGR